MAGDANHELTFTRDGKLLVDASVTTQLPSPRPRLALAPSAATSASSAARSTATTRYADVERRTLAKAALQQAGFKAAMARRAVSIAEARVPSDANLETLIREALRHCS